MIDDQELRVIIAVSILGASLLIWFHKQALGRLDRNHKALEEILTQLRIDHASLTQMVQANTEGLRGVHHRINKECVTTS